MTEANTNKSNGWNNNTIIIAVTIVVLVVIFMFFRNRQQNRHLQLQRMDRQMDVWEEWGPQRQNRQMGNKMGGGGGRIL